MRQVSRFPWVAALLALGVACSNTTANSGGTANGGGDTSSDSSVSEDASSSDTASTDTGGGNDTLGGTDAGTDGSADGVDNPPDLTDSADISDTQGDNDAVDTGFAADIQPDDAGSPDVPDIKPGSCVTDADCLGLNFAPCLIGFCDAGSGMCKVKPAADGGSCTVSGPCGGAGTCKSGSCNAPSTCKPDVCSPQELSCGTSITIELSQLGASTFMGYGDCSSLSWPGPEAAVLLASDVTLIASLSIETTGVNADVQMFDIAPTVDGKCDAFACDDSSYYSLQLGLPAGVPRIVMIDTSAPDTGSVTLTLDCTAATYCGDQTCSDTENCGNCPADCGDCPNTDCGNGTCNPTENCITCPGDCGACTPGCVYSEAPGCGTCDPALQACVCDADSYCCNNHWDNTCVEEFSQCPGVMCPPFNDVCGDKICGSNEYGSCDADCNGTYLYCGDGLCTASNGEDCKGCATDCGFCLVTAGATSGCGDGTCKGDEDCTNCAADCGTCGDYTCACLEDPTCCTEEFGYYCQNLCESCIGQNGGGSCPISNCGDGICAGETCQSCPMDCGDCPAYCGDGNCDPGEDLATCPSDCAVGCKGKCNYKSKEADGSTCWCDSYCTSAGDCCSDKTQYCP